MVTKSWAKLIPRQKFIHICTLKIRDGWKYSQSLEDKRVYEIMDSVGSYNLDCIEFYKTVDESKRQVVVRLKNAVKREVQKWMKLTGRE